MLKINLKTIGVVTAGLLISSFALAKTSPASMKDYPLMASKGIQLAGGSSIGTVGSGGNRIHREMELPEERGTAWTVQASICQMGYNPVALRASEVSDREMSSMPIRSVEAYQIKVVCSHQSMGDDYEVEAKMDHEEVMKAFQGYLESVDDSLNQDSWVEL